ncbi:MAG TPA: hypothetical protein VGB73_06210 [Pyrinomonadaceae bacterium]|jgi:hypothetical protein
MAAFLLTGLAYQSVRAEVWNSIEPLKSRRADVERVLGKPLEDKAGETGTLRFKVAGGTVQVSFVNARFVTTKKLSPELEGTVLQVVLQHERATDTPESLGLINNSNFQREEKQNVVQFRNLKDGIAYTFIEGKLKTTWYSPASEQLLRARIKG